jgi:hypothetical protein
MIIYKIEFNGGEVSSGIEQDIKDFCINNGIDESNITNNSVEITTIKPIIKSITPMYLRIVLSQMGLLTPILAELNKVGNETKLIAFEYALEFKRDHPFIKSLGTSLGMSESQLDALFISANNLKIQVDGE